MRSSELTGNHLQKIRTYKEAKKDEVKKLLNTISRHQFFLLPGKYRVANGMKRIYYLNNRRNRVLIRKIHNHYSRPFKVDSLNIQEAIKKTIDYFTFKTVAINNQGITDFGGELIMVTRYFNLRIFNLKKMKIVSFIDDRKSYECIKAAYDNLSDHFRMTFLNFSEEEQKYEEKFIDFIPFHNWKKEDIENAISFSFESYREYFKDRKAVRKNMTAVELRNKFEKHVSSDQLKKTVDQILEKRKKTDSFQLVMCHGDFNFTNMLFDGRELHIIDWESFGEYVFFYDLINLFFAEAYYGDFSLLTDYFNGKYDQAFQGIFNEMGTEYMKEDRILYFAVFMMTRIAIYERNAGVELNDHIYNKYLTVLNKAVLLQERKNKTIQGE